MKQGLLLILAFIFLRCNDDHVTTPDLNGQWVSLKTGTDTLTFGVFGDQKSMILGRGEEMRDGFQLPKYGAGPYTYKLLPDDKISLNWTFSSNSNFNTYYFKQSGDQLVIENFFDSSASGTRLTFIKLE